MKPKSFKSNGGDQFLFGHCIIDPADIVFEGSRIEININNINNTDFAGDGHSFDPEEPVEQIEDQIFAVLLDSGKPDSEVLFARGRRLAVAGVDNTSDRARLILEEHKRSSEFQSTVWTMFLQDLKKAFGSDDHNKKQKVLHVIKMQNRVENLPASIKMKVQFDKVLENGKDKLLLYAIQQRLFDYGKISLDELSKLISSVTPQATMTVGDEVKYSRRVDGYNATTSIVTRIPLSISKSLGDNFEITIPSPFEQQATMGFDTENNTAQKTRFDEVLDEILPEMLPINYEPFPSASLSIYDFEKKTYLCHRENIKKIETSQSGEYGIGLSDEKIVASFLREQEINQSLCIFHKYKPLEDEDQKPVDELEDRTPVDELVDKPFLEFNYEAYEIKEDHANPRKRYLRVKVDNRRQLEVLREIETVSVMVNGIDGIDDQVEFMTIEGVWDNELNQGFIDLSVFDPNKSGQSTYPNLFLDKVEAHQHQHQLDLVIKGVQRAILQKSALMLTIRPEALSPTSTSPDLEQLSIDLTAYLEGGKRRLEDVDAWVKQRQSLVVVEAEHLPQLAIMMTKSSVTPGVPFEISSSKNGRCTYFDVSGGDIAELKTHVYTSEIPERPTPRLESVSNVNFVLHLEEVKRPQEDALRGYQNQIMSVYNGENKHVVCNNEQVHKIMRKKKDGKCIYRIVVKHGVAARQMAYGKYQNCTFYLDNLPGE
jgi:hypothetical protein